MTCLGHLPTPLAASTTGPYCCAALSQRNKVNFLNLTGLLSSQSGTIGPRAVRATVKTKQFVEERRERERR